MARPSNALVWNNTPRLGIPFQWLLDDMQSKWARDASAESVCALVSWEDSEEFLQEAVGYVTWDGVSPTLNRVLPLESPLRTGLFCDECVQVEYGAYEDRTDFNDPIRDNIPVQDWVIIRLTFIRPRWKVRGNNALAGLFGNKENMRFTTMSLMPRPRERIVSGWGMEFDNSAAGHGKDPAAWVVVPEEKSFIPTWETDIRITWYQVPLGAVPHRAIEECGATVNANPMQLVPGGKIWPPGMLLFKGLGNPIEMYQGADLSDLFDLTYLFTATAGGWNNFLARDPVNGGIKYKPMSVRRGNGTHPNPDGVPNASNSPRQPILPPYLSSDFQRLFTPSADV